MTLTNEPNREPSLADLEAFERLLRESLKAGGPIEAGAQMPAPVAAPPPLSADEALAAFNRLVEAPVVFEQPGEPPSVSRISAIEQALRADLDQAPAPEPDKLRMRDPLIDFSAELRRFEALSRPPLAEPAHPVEPHEDLRGGYSGEGRPMMAGAGLAPDMLSMAEERLQAEAEAAAHAGGAAAMAGAATGSANRSRSIFLALGGVALAGLAVIGGVTAFSGAEPAGTAANGKVPVIAARPEPAKERPANPGGLEVPDQNKQVLAARNPAANGQRPAQIINQTEQPVDLNQIARRDSTRLAGSPAPGLGSIDQPGAAPPPGEPRRVQSVRIADPVAPPPATTPSVPLPGAAPAPGAGAITTISAGSGPARTAPANPGSAVSGSAPGSLSGSGAALPAASTPGAQAAIRPQASATPAPAMPVPPTPATASPSPKLPVPPSPAGSGRSAPEAPKAESRPQSPVANQRPAATPPVPPAPRNAAPVPLTRPTTGNAQPDSPSNPPSPAQVATAGGGAFAVQLAWRSSEADAQNTGRQLGQRFAEQIGGKSPVVVRGEANGQVVYRVRVMGFAQAEASAACDRIRASGGACFVTRQ